MKKLLDRSVLSSGCTFLLMAATAWVLSGCGRGSEKSQDETLGKPCVFVSIVPQQTFVQRIAGERVDVKVMVLPGHSPATYEPTPRQMADLAKARIFFATGVPFETAWLPTLREANPSINIVDTCKGIALRDIDGAGESEGHESHGAHDGHSCSGHHHHAGMKDPHVWLNPRLVRIQAKTICAELTRMLPQYEAEFAANLLEFDQDLVTVDKQIRSLMTPLKQRRFMVFHPSWGYFADEYGMKQIPVEVSGREPSAKELGHLIETARTLGVRVLFVQRQFSSQSVQAIADAVDGRVQVLDPLAPDYLENLLLMARTIAEVNQ